MRITSGCPRGTAQYSISDSGTIQNQKKLNLLNRPLLGLFKRLGYRAFSACAQVLPSSLLCPNMWSVARYEPGSGLRSHVDVPQLGPYVLDGSFGSGAEMVFEPRPLPGSTLFKKRQKVFLQRRSLLLLPGEARDKWKHQILARDYDTVEKRRIPRDSRVSLVFRHTGVGTGLHTTSSEPPDPEQHETN